MTIRRDRNWTKRSGILPGTGWVPIHNQRTANKTRGGVFGQPPAPAGRTYGIFQSYYAIPPEQMNQDTGLLSAFTGQKVPGSVMDAGRQMPYMNGGHALAGLGQAAATAVDEVSAEAQSLTKKIGEYMFGPPPATAAEGIMRQNQKRAWFRFAILAGLLYVTGKRVVQLSGRR